MKNQFEAWKNKGNGDKTTRYLILITLSCLLLGPNFWKLSGLLLSLVIGFLVDRLHEQELLCF
jgi:hypothetical protein